jgi:hypothetical protein
MDGNVQEWAKYPLADLDVPRLQMEAQLFLGEAVVAEGNRFGEVVAPR